MDIRDLMKRLAALYPNQLGTQATVDAWGGEYKRALAKYQGPTLQRAFDQTIDEWIKTTFPKPADILAAVRRIKGTSAADDQGNGISAKAFGEYVIPRSEQLKTLAVEDARNRWHGETEFPEQQVRDIAHNLAWAYASAEFRVEQRVSAPDEIERHRYLLTDDEIEIAEGRWRTQKGLPPRSPRSLGRATSDLLDGAQW